MRFFNLNIRSGLIGAVLSLIPAVAGLTSCGMIYDDLEPCPEGVNLRFIYDYNMEFANAFPAKVHCLTVFVYDEAGKYVTTRTETSRDLLSDEGYRNAKCSEQEGEIKIKSHAAVVAGKLYPDKKPRQQER